MSRTCASSTCTEHTTGYSRFCEKHKRAMRRHGHADQTAVTAAELKTTLARVKARRKRNPKSDAWTILAMRWDTLVAAAKSTVDAHAAGRASARPEVIAAGHVQKLAQEAETADVVDTALAMFLLREERPHRFRSDKAFQYQLVRRVRALASSNAGQYTDSTSGKRKRVYRDMLPGTIERLAVRLTEAFGAAGLMLAAREEQDRAKAVEESRRLASAIKDFA